MRQISRLIVVMLYLWPLAGLAADAIELEADRVEIDDKAGIGRYLGNVHMIQGPLSILADKMIVYRDGRKLARIVFQGSPVRFAQQPGDGRKEIRGHASSVEYSAGDKMLVLLDQAEVWQEKDHFSGDIIRYDMEKKQILASSGDGDGRVRVVINPDDISAEPKQTAPEPAITNPSADNPGTTAPSE